jgi:hypothetical protein
MWVVSSAPRPPSVQWIGGWVGPRAGFEGVWRRGSIFPLLGFEPRTVHPVPACYTVQEVLYYLSQSLDVCMGYSNNNSNNHNNNKGAITGHSEAKQPDIRFAVAAPSSKHCTEQKPQGAKCQYSLSIAPPFPKEHCFLEGSQASPVCRFGRQRTHSLSFIKASQLVLCREIITVCSEIHTKHINTLCGQNVELLNVKPVKFSLVGGAA